MSCLQLCRLQTKWMHRNLLWLVLLFIPSVSWSGSLLIETDGVAVYTGPGERYRILTRLNARAQVQASEKIVSSPFGRFYKVLVPISEKQKKVGYIPVTAPVRSKSDAPDSEEFEKYGPVALTSSALQITYAQLKDQQQLITLGYMDYLTTGFFVKGAVGQWITPSNTNAVVALGEIGNDSLLAGRISGFVTYGLGLFIPPSAGTIFTGSQRTNLLMQATMGLRYNISGFASFSASAIQAAAFNANNSLVSNGFQVSIEVGI